MLTCIAENVVGMTNASILLAVQCRLFTNGSVCCGSMYCRRHTHLLESTLECTVSRGIQNLDFEVLWHRRVASSPLQPGSDSDPGCQAGGQILWPVDNANPSMNELPGGETRAREAAMVNVDTLLMCV